MTIHRSLKFEKVLVISIWSEKAKIKLLEKFFKGRTPKRGLWLWNFMKKVLADAHATMIYNFG